MDSISTPYTNPSPPGVATREESDRRMAFQAAHPHVGFQYLADCEKPEKPWIAYWLVPDSGRRWVTGPTLADVLDTLAEEFEQP